jgi:hypothetical protein
MFRVWLAGSLSMAWKTFYLAFGFAMAVGVAVILATTHEDAYVKTDRLNVTPATIGFNMDRFAG